MSIDSELSIIAPQFDSMDTTRRNGYIAWASTFVSTTCFGAMYERAGAAVAAHLATLYPDGGPSSATSLSGGPLIGIREGDTGINFGFLQQAATADQWWLKTSYGSMWLMIREASACSGPFLAKP